MKVEDPYLKYKKYKKYISEDIYNSRIVEFKDIENWEIAEMNFEKAPVHLEEAKNLEFTSFELYDTWGGYNKYAWFKTKILIDSKWDDKDMMLCLQPGPRDEGGSTAEGLVYFNDEIIQAIDIWHNEVKIEPELIKKENEIYLKVWSGVLNVPKKRRFMEAKIAIYSKEVYRFYYLIDNLLEVTQTMDTDNLAYFKIFDIVEKSFKQINFLNYKSKDYYNSIEKAIEVAELELKQLEGLNELKPQIHSVGHSHIDMAWLWTLDASIDKASRTFSTMLKLIKDNPKFKYIHSSPALYEMVGEKYPRILDKVKKEIKNENWEITGGMWVESDTYIPSGESLIRQFVYGQRYIKKITGSYSKVLWLPDVFGYSSCLPQIMKKSQIESFMTTKISWNQYNNLPHDTFDWVGVDGSSILTHFITTPDNDSWFYTYNGQNKPDELSGIWKNYKDKDKNSDLLLAYGWGDGGGGPTEKMISSFDTIQNIPTFPSVKPTLVEPYFDLLHKKIENKELGKWHGELYFELHRGTLTSQAFVKKENKEVEILLKDVEYLHFLVSLISDQSEYKNIIDKLWKKVLLLQFHDILPGTSINEVYVDCKRDYLTIKNELNEIVEFFINLISNKLELGKNNFIVFNTLGFKRNVELEVETDKNSVYFNDKLLNSSYNNNILSFTVDNVEPYSFALVRLDFVDSKKNNKLDENYILENKYMKVMVDKSNGSITSCINKVNNIELVNSVFNEFACYEDKPINFDAWDIDVFYKQKRYSNPKLIDIGIVCDDEYQKIIKTKYKFNKSIIEQMIILKKDAKYITFETNVDWNEENVLFKTYFNSNIISTYGRTESQYGFNIRPTHSDTSWDFAKFEVCGHRYGEVSNTNSGFAVLNDCKYGYDFSEGSIGLSLIKSATFPDKMADKCRHEFKYALYPYDNGFETANLMQVARSFASIPIARNINNAVLQENVYDFNPIKIVETSNTNIVIDCIKNSDIDENCFVLRLFESEGKKSTSISFSTFLDIEKVVETDLLEENPVTIGLSDIMFKPYEIKTIKVYYNKTKEK